MGRTGFFGGTFNPIHSGHIHLAEEAFRGLGLDRLILVPANIPPHKEAHDLCSNTDRFNMCCLAAEGHEGFEVSDFELNQGGKSYSVYTAEHFAEMYPDDELYMMHYYLEKGHSIRELQSLTFAEKIFMSASMLLTGEEMKAANGQ